MKNAMKHFHVSLFDIVSTVTVLAVLTAMLLIGPGNQAHAASEPVASSSFSADLLFTEDKPEDLNGGTVGSGELRTTIVDVINVLLTFVGIIAVILFIWAGFLMMTAAGNDEQVEKGKKTMIWAAIGIIVILFAWVLVDFIIDTGQTN